MFLDYFDTLMSKIILKNKNKKYYFDIFSNKKHFKNTTVITLWNKLVRFMHEAVAKIDEKYTNMLLEEQEDKPYNRRRQISWNSLFQ